MTENDYFLAWGIYAIAAIGCLLVWMRMTRWMWRWLRQPLRLLMMVLLFTPTIVDPVKEKFAPAVAITALDVLFKNVSNGWRAMSDLAMYGMIALGLYVLYALIRWPFERSANARRDERLAQQAAAAKAAADEPRTPDEPFSASGNDRFGRNPPTPPSPGSRLRVEPRL